MTSLLSNIKTGKIKRPHFIILYGVDGVGKTTFGAQAPDPIFIGPESGFGNLSVSRFPSPANFIDILTYVQTLKNEDHNYKTLVLDSLDWIEPLVHAHVCENKHWSSIEDPGYGKGYVEVNSAWLQLINLLKSLREKMNVICLAHATIRTFTDPQENQAYDRYQLKLAGQGAKTDASALWREAVDTVLFANFEVTTTKEKGERKAKAFGEGTRVVYTERRPAFDAKNRFGLPFEMPLSWEAYEKASSVTLDDNWKVFLRDHQAVQVNIVNFLISKGMLKPHETLSDVSEQIKTKIVSDQANFLEAVLQSIKGK